MKIYHYNDHCICMKGRKFDQLRLRKLLCAEVVVVGLGIGEEVSVGSTSESVLRGTTGNSNSFNEPGRADDFLRDAYMEGESEEEREKEREGKNKI